MIYRRYLKDCISVIYFHKLQISRFILNPLWINEAFQTNAPKEYDFKEKYPYLSVGTLQLMLIKDILTKNSIILLFGSVF